MTTKTEPAVAAARQAAVEPRAAVAQQARAGPRAPVVELRALVECRRGSRRLSIGSPLIPCEQGTPSAYQVDVTVENAVGDVTIDGDVFACSPDIEGPSTEITCPNNVPYEGQVMVLDDNDSGDRSVHRPGLRKRFGLFELGGRDPRQGNGAYTWAPFPFCGRLLT